MEFDNWLDTFLKEKDIDIEFKQFFVEHNGYMHIIDIDQLINLCKKTDISQKVKIKETLVKLDFKNQNILDYFEYLAKAYIFTNF